MIRANEGRRWRLDWLWTSLRLICIAVIAVTLVMLVQLWMEDRAIDEGNRKLQELYMNRAGAEEIPSVSAEPTPEPTVPPMQEALLPVYAENSDTVGWLIAGESISLPVVQQADNEYYLYRDFYGADSKAGTLFMDRRCTVWPANNHWMIHGHNMKDGSMFGTLDNFRELDYLKQYPIVTFDSLYETGLYVPVAMFDASMTRDAYGYFKIARFEFEGDEDFLSFVEEICAKSLYDIPVDVQADDQLLTLVTCSYYHDNGRLILVCRKLREGETVEGMTELMQEATAR